MLQLRITVSIVFKVGFDGLLVPGCSDITRYARAVGVIRFHSD